MEIDLSPAADVPFSDFVALFNAAYRDYAVPLHMEAHAMQHLIERDNIDLACLAGGPPPEWSLVGVGMLARRRTQGWIGGLGVIPGFRGQGIGKRLMYALLDQAARNGLRGVQLEVIQGNIPAYTLYKKLGFWTERELLTVESTGNLPQVPASPFSLEGVSSGQALIYHSVFHPAPNPWQRQLESLYALRDSMNGVVIRLGEQVVAYAVGWFYREVIRWMDMACASDHSAALEALIVHLHQQNPEAQGSYINLPSNSPAWEVLRRLHYRVTVKQFEMHQRLAFPSADSAQSAQ
ncbi:MAG: GNAT family N-acetyltransferase [Anaerolineae bacterium]|nr:GNAT family N-acetyltransferase [Anaerolineae bacterium]